MDRKWKKMISSGIFLIALMFWGCVSAAGLDYGDANNWAYYGSESGAAQPADIFFVGPTVFFGNETERNMPINDQHIRKNFLGAVNMEKGIYDVSGNFYAPYYRQAALVAYQLEPVTAEPYFDLAYQDVKDAFVWYLHESNANRPIVLAGFSQGADMVLRLMKDLYADPLLQEKLVAAYAIGWRVTAEDLARYPQLKMAQGELDTGVIISFNTEAQSVTTSLMVPERTLGINPLNWKTTGEMADKELNRGAVFPGYDGHIKKEIPCLTGAFLDEIRGTLKVTDISPESYPPILDVIASGVYHIYDYQFFYRNLQDNVRERVAAFQARKANQAGLFESGEVHVVFAP
ncbi:MAG TPA: DUF3089 domain-containing protein [Patescibacteria group bacterium]|nr:DUF3089 domain-containing protein [Patescibacteria group bacterium]